MTTTADPVRWDRTINRGTDHDWTVRKVAPDGVAIIPTEAKAQVRQVYGGPVWVECRITIDPVDGWVTVTIPEADTLGSEWDNRSAGIWDLECVYSAKKHRWVEGSITVTQDVTRDI